MKKPKKKPARTAPKPSGKALGEEAILAKLIERVSTKLGVPASSIDASAPMTAYGLDSLESVSLMVDLEKLLGRKLDPTLFWQYPELRGLARRLAQEAASPPKPGGK